ncbi:MULTISPECIES: hypothetical protein [Aliarcobacter]|uniref:Uncharacterized protein n=1 Tax=Aliarcobacter cibarius TaxID=255507 RepID=A0ABY2V2V4_9BACT|nr:MULTISPECIES: hypothetical protein [Aliarcobacter]MDK2047856.1 hypothetical protein [Aliarcobacter butzleri]TLS96824.1 hypothetical protein FE247_09360 [Aliarcobacter cibarius]TLS97329.1 hypothetical protein FE245_09370 [Aliarcobacter cibarius]
MKFIIDNYDLFYLDSCDNINNLTSITSDYDLLISAYNNEEMVFDVFTNIQSEKKVFLLLPDYNDLDLAKLSGLDIYKNEIVTVQDKDLELNYINDFIEKFEIETYRNKKLCIDITGFVKPYMVYFIKALYHMGFKNIDIIYSEPKLYTNQEETEFSEEEIINTRSINGYDLREEYGKDDLLIINAGYDHKLIRSITGHKKFSRKQVLIGFPSLQPIMYQENILNLQKAYDDLGIKHTSKLLYAKANDPFETAKIIKKYILKYINKMNDVKTIYFAPLGTKPQALGIVLFTLLEENFFEEKDILLKIIYPFSKSYSSSAGKKLFQINRYRLEF